MNASNTLTHVRCQRPPIPAALLCPFSVGEIISQESVIKLDDGEPAPLAFRPFGDLSMEGEVARALPTVLAWINPEATVTGTGWSWRDAISEQLLRGDSVKIGELPEGVLLTKPTPLS